MKTLLEKFGIPLICIAFLALLLWVTYERGYGNGKSQGLTEGFRNGVAAQKVETDAKQATINDLIGKENERVATLNTRIAELEKKSSDLADALEQEKLRKEKVRTEIVTRYLEANPQLSTSCGWSAPTVEVVNQLTESANAKHPN